jgi:hypothetical protein
MSTHRMGLAGHASGSTRVNPHRAERVHAVPPSGPDVGAATALCGKEVQLWGTGLFDADMRSPGGVCPVCAAEHRLTRGAA